MKVLNVTLLMVVLTVLVSCGGTTDKQPANADGFGIIEKELKSKFGDQAYYTNLVISYNDAIGNIISVTATENPESLKMGEWNLTQSTWNQTAEVSLEVPEGNKAADFMFQLNEKINLSKLGALVEKSNKQLEEEKGIKNPKLHMAFIKFPKNGEMSKTEYSIMLKPENGGTTFSFDYALNGELLRFDY
ncbi:hypothetical protein [Aquimarina rhabdastrellae]